MTPFHCCLGAFSRNSQRSQRDSLSVWENKQNINLLPNPKQKAWGQMSQDVNLWRINKWHEINEMVLALEWKSVYHLNL